MTRLDWRETALTQTQGVRRVLLRQGVVLGAVVSLLWLIEIVDQTLLRGALDGWGVTPRTLEGLRAIVIAPWLHGGFGHLLANTIPLVVLGWLVMVRRISDFFTVAIIAALVSGLGIWLFGGANTVHIGISGVIFGFLGYLLARGWYERGVSAIALGVVALVLYGGMLWGVLPLQQGVSWQGHLFGFLGGVLAAFWLTRPRRSLPSPVQ